MRGEGKKLERVARVQARGQLYIPQQGTQDDPDAEVDAALAAVGLYLVKDDADEAPPDDKCYLWPCNLVAFNVWQSVQTQWRVGGMGGRRTGLAYEGVATYMRDVARIKPTTKRYAEIWSGIQAMERAALEEWAEQQQD